jgi:hypothetical protein
MVEELHQAAVEDTEEMDKMLLAHLLVVMVVSDIHLQLVAHL